MRIWIALLLTLAAAATVPAQQVDTPSAEPVITAQQQQEYTRRLQRKQRIDDRVKAAGRTLARVTLDAAIAARELAEFEASLEVDAYELEKADDGKLSYRAKEKGQDATPRSAPGASRKVRCFIQYGDGGLTLSGEIEVPCIAAQ